MKSISAIILGVLLISATNVKAIQMFGKDEYGYNLPLYEKMNPIHATGSKLVIYAIADEDNFPVSSFKQGSVFSKVFSDLKEEMGISIIIESQKENFEEAAQHMERGGRIAGAMDYSGIGINGIFGAPFKSRIYSRNKDIYPAFFVNNIHILTSAQNDLDLKEKKDLSKYKGVYVKTDRISENVLNDFQNLGMKEVDSFSEAYKQLLTNQIDFIAASYYPSLFKAFELGLRDYIIFSKNPVWKMPLFIRVRPEVMNNKKTEEFSRYLKSNQYKKRVKEAFEELVEIYRKNTEGIVPPTYIKEDATLEEQMLEN